MRRASRQNFSDTTPAAPEGYLNVKWQSDRQGNRSGYVPESAGADVVSDEAYSGSWDGVVDVAPSKNAVYDKIESLSGGGNGNPYNLCVFPDINDFSLLNLPAVGVVHDYGNSANGLLYINASVDAGGNIVRLFYQPSPGAASTVTAAFHLGFPVPGGVSSTQGIWLYDTGSGKLLCLGIHSASGGGTPGYRIHKQYWTDSSTLSSLAFDMPIYPLTSPMVWLRIIDNGSSLRAFYISFDGEIFAFLGSETRTTHFTSPDSVGVGMIVWASAGTTSIMSVPSFLAT